MYIKIIVLLLVILLSLVSGFQLNNHHHHHYCMRSTRLAMAEIKVTKAVSEDVIKKLGMKGWPTWGCGVSKFPWTYGDSETALIIKGIIIIVLDITNTIIIIVIDITNTTNHHHAY